MSRLPPPEAACPETASVVVMSSMSAIEVVLERRGPRCTCIFRRHQTSIKRAKMPAVGTTMAITIIDEEEADELGGEDMDAAGIDSITGVGVGFGPRTGKGVGTGGEVDATNRKGAKVSNVAASTGAPVASVVDVGVGSGRGATVDAGTEAGVGGDSLVAAGTGASEGSIVDGLYVAMMTTPSTNSSILAVPNDPPV